MLHEISLAAYESKAISLDGQYLIVRDSSDYFSISAIDLPATTLNAGDSADVRNFENVTIRNPHDKPITISLQPSRIAIQTNQGDSVKVQNAVTVQEILTPIAVTAEATVTDGLKVEPITPPTFKDYPDKKIAPGEKIILASSNSKRKEIFIQVVSQSHTKLRIGAPTVASNRGLIVSGSEENPALLTLNTHSELWAVNLDQVNEAELSICEVVTL